jgi:hypothetical protein
MKEYAEGGRRREKEQNRRIHDLLLYTTHELNRRVDVYVMQDKILSYGCVSYNLRFSLEDALIKEIEPLWNDENDIVFLQLYTKHWLD